MVGFGGITITKKVSRSGDILREARIVSASPALRKRLKTIGIEKDVEKEKESIVLSEGKKRFTGTLDPETGEILGVRTVTVKEQEERERQRRRGREAVLTEGVKTFVGRVQEGKFIGVRTVMQREQQLRESERKGFFSIDPRLERQKRVDIGRELAIRKALPITTRGIPLSQRVELKFEEKPPKKERGTKGLAGFLSSISARQEVREKGLFAVKQEEFKLKEQRIREAKTFGELQPSLLQDIKFKGDVEKLRESKLDTLRVERRFGLAFAEKPEIFIATPAVGALFGFGAAALASFGTTASTLVSIGEIGLFGTAVLEVGRQIKEAPKEERLSIAALNALLFAEFGIGALGGGLSATKAGFIREPPIGIRPFRVKLGEKTKSFGLTLEAGTKAQPLISLTEGKLKIGTPKIDFTQLKHGETFITETATQARILKESIKTGKTSIDVTEALKFELGTSVIKKTKSIETIFKRDFPKITERLTPKGVEITLNFIKEKKGKIFGSFSQQTQIAPEFIRLAGDIDVKISGNIVKETNILLKRFQEAGIRARLAKETPGAIEVFVGGKFQKAVEFKPIFDPLGSFGEQAPETFIGINLEGKPTKIKGIKVQRLSKQGVAKGASIFTLRAEEKQFKIPDIISNLEVVRPEVKQIIKGLPAEPTIQKSPFSGLKVEVSTREKLIFTDLKFAPKSHRIKDIPDFFAVEDTLLQSSLKPLKRTRKDFLRLKEQFERNLLPESFQVDLTPIEEPSFNKLLSKSIKDISLSSRAGISSSLLIRPFSISKSISLSASPSISVSPSPRISPSISVSPSPRISPSISVSPSPSISQSISVSPSPSISQSISVSPSPSISQSISVSPSISITEIPPPPPPPSPPLLFPKLKLKQKKIKERFDPFEQEKLFVPSLTAFELGLHGKLDEKKLFAGFELRPITKKVTRLL